jgi:hypothetical protein
VQTEVGLNKSSAESAEQQSPGIRHSPEISPERAAQLRSFAASPFQGFFMVVLTQGCGCGAAFTLGFAAPRFQRWIDSHAIQGRNFEFHFRLHLLITSQLTC